MKKLWTLLRRSVPSLLFVLLFFGMFTCVAFLSVADGIQLAPGLGQKAPRIGTDMDDCMQCVPVEIDQTVCYVYDWWDNTHTVYTCGQPPWVDPLFEVIGSTVLPKERGFKRNVVTATYYPSTILEGHSASFQQWWNDRLNAPPGSGSSGPGASYSTDITASTSASQGYYISSETDSYGVPYTLKTWSCSPTGQSCPKTVYVYGTDGE